MDTAEEDKAVVHPRSAYHRAVKQRWRGAERAIAGLLMASVSCWWGAGPSLAESPAAQTAGAGTSIYVRDSSFTTSSAFEFQNVSWVALSPDRELYVLQRGTSPVTIWSADGALLRSWTTVELGDPHSLRFQRLPDGEKVVWITDMAPPNPAGPGFGHCLKRFTPSGDFLGNLGTCGVDSQGSGLDPIQFDKVTDVAFDAASNIWVTDGDIDGLNNRVVQLSPGGKALQVWSAPNNQPGSGQKEFNLPHAIDIDDCDRVWIADTLNHRVQIVRTDGTFLQQLQCFGQDGIYGLRVRKASGSDRAQLVTTASPTTAPSGGTVRIFDIAPQCSAPLPVPGQCTTSYTWNITLTDATSTAMLHATDANDDVGSLYLATLGGDLVPQRWIRVYLPR